MLTVAEAAKRACVSESVIRGWIKAGQLPHYRLGQKGKRGKIAITVEDLDGALANFKVSGPAAKPTPIRHPIKLRHLKLS